MEIVLPWVVMLLLWTSLLALTVIEEHYDEMFELYPD